jgi:Trk K+ transport system NAD-binding subunit
MKRNRFVIVGIGSVGEELLRKLSPDIDLACIDLDEATVERVSTLRKDCAVFVGDATSRLVLEAAGVDNADGIIITTTSEKVNIEAARVLKEHFDPKRVIALGTTSGGIAALEALGVEVENIFTASATVIRNRLEQRSRAPHAIGLGKEEILEVEIHPHSRLANRPLRTLTPIQWRIGIIYRGENIIVPRRDTVLKPKDRLIILGEPSVIKTVSEILTFRFKRFPLEYGSAAIAYLHGNEPESFFQELGYIFSVFPLNRLILIYSEKAAQNEESLEILLERESMGSIEKVRSVRAPLQAIGDVISGLKGDQGLIIASRGILSTSFLGVFRKWRGRGGLSSFMELSKCPVLLPAGTFPYAKTAVPCTDEAGLRNALETAIEIASSMETEVWTLLVNPSKYISSDEDTARHESIIKTINELSSLHKLSVNKKTLEGNPAKAVTASLPDYNLMITGMERWGRKEWLPTLLNPDVTSYVLRRTGISTLLLPSARELLQR